MSYTALSRALTVAAVISAGSWAAGEPLTQGEPVTVDTPQPTLDWAQKMFSELGHDFGSIAERSDANVVFEVKNLYEETIQINHVETSCHCMLADYDKREIKTGEVCRIKVSVNTRDFSGDRKPNLNIDLTYEKVLKTNEKKLISKHMTLPLHAFIRSDVVLSPTGTVDFGSAEMGVAAEKTITVEYRGSQQGWQVKEAKTSGENLKATITPVTNSFGQVQYQLKVRLEATAPLGAIKDQITLVTTDQLTPMIPVTVVGTVEPEITISPSTNILLGDMNPGAEKKTTIVVKGRRPFVIEKLECPLAPESFKVDKPFAKEPATLHIVPLVVTAPKESGPFTEAFQLTISGHQEPVKFQANGRIIDVTGTAVTPTSGETNGAAKTVSTN